MKYVAFLLGLWMLSGCTPKVIVQQNLAARVHKATIQCVALPSGPAKAKLCATALICQTTAQSAAEALQKAQAATAAGSTDIAAEASAAGLGVLADSACKQGGW